MLTMISISLLSILSVALGASWCDNQLVRRRDSKHVYRVGVLAIRGIETAYKDFNTTFSTYLTETAGKRFDPPISFEVVPAVPGNALDTFRPGVVDFVFANPSMYSCIESEIGANSLATFISQRKVNGQTYVLEEFGGVIFTRANNTNINRVEDIRGKKVGCVSITGLGSGQMQFRVLQQAGIHHLQDPRQLLFMRGQNNVVNGVLAGIIDVGFVRTDQLERTIDERTGELVDLSKIKIIGAKELTQSNGSPFPFTSSTELYPEWNIASLPHVPDDVSQMVQSALLRLDDHATSTLCDTTAVLASTAFNAKTQGKYAGFRSTLSYMTLRTMQEEIDFINRNEDGTGVKCARAEEVKDAVVCPPGHYKRDDDDIDTGCQNAGLPCHGYQCLCSPCVKAFEVDFLPKDRPGTKGCSKFELCSEVQQSHTIEFRATDNRKRENAQMSVVVIDGQESNTFKMERVSGFSNQYSFNFVASKRAVGVVILEVYLDGVQISESPFRVEISSRDCKEDTGDPLSVASESGRCTCETSAFSIAGSRCIRLGVFLPCLILPLIVAIVIAACRDARNKKRQADSIWTIDPSEIQFGNPPRVLGQGTFGAVILANYRGTKVAVKRALPKKRRGGIAKRLSMSTDGGSQWSDHEGPKQVDPTTFFDNCEDVEAPRVVARRSSRVSSGGGSGRSFEVNNAPLSVMDATWNPTRNDVARMRSEFAMEMRSVSKLRHPCVATVMGALFSHDASPKLVIEYMELGSLYDVLHNETMIIEDDKILPILRDIASGLRFLHASDPQIVHGDLRATNILMDGSFRAKLTGFGFSQKRTVSKNEGSSTGVLWLAPELLLGSSDSTPASDSYAFGMVVYEMFSRREPFEGENQKEVVPLIVDPTINKRPIIPESVPVEVVDIMQSCFEHDPEYRPNAEEIDLSLKMLNAERTEALLLEIFPKHIAASLRSGKQIEPESFDEVTVYFSDIVGYTSIASSLTPTKVTSLLDRLYTKFDALCNKYNIFKVETVGDAYMTVTNLAVKQKDHVHIMAKFALEAQQCASETLIDEDDPSLGCVKIRAGFHSGPVAAHVIGSRQPRYSIIGDTVNVSARMESHSKPGRIQCSEESAKHLKHSDLDIVRRGSIRIKGKGEMTTYWVRSKICPALNSSDNFGVPTTTLTSTESKDSFDSAVVPPKADQVDGTNSASSQSTKSFLKKHAFLPAVDETRKPEVRRKSKSSPSLDGRIAL